jgi:hypothetical protein
MAVIMETGHVHNASEEEMRDICGLVDRATINYSETHSAIKVIPSGEKFRTLDPSRVENIDINIEKQKKKLFSRKKDIFI